MELVVGENTYVTIEEANEYVENSMLSTDGRKTAWEKLCDNDKAVYLRNSLLEIESLPFIGYKVFLDQPLCFPRVRSAFGSPTTIPNIIKTAQMKNALAMLPVTENAGILKRKQLQLSGVTSTSMEGFSESYVFINNANKVTDRSVLDLLTPWLIGAIDIE